MNGTTPDQAELPSIKVTCCNCYNEKEVSLLHIGVDLKKFFDEHRTRIGNRYCKREDVCVRYDPFAQQPSSQAIEQGEEKTVLLCKHPYCNTKLQVTREPNETGRKA